MLRALWFIFIFALSMELGSRTLHDLADDLLAYLIVPVPRVFLLIKLVLDRAQNILLVLRM